ncbi:hypothetical protein CCMA1212_008259 [Trichoderma ghanense]|uniref:Uncharacterized protein n=1 Tax=Trichoderma ghanense TaxID=65468 RepID=A0ABY2GVP2_9HYPO
MSRAMGEHSAPCDGPEKRAQRWRTAGTWPASPPVVVPSRGFLWAQPRKPRTVSLACIGYDCHGFFFFSAPAGIGEQWHKLAEAVADA